MPGTYLVTGGAGFIGSHIAARLIRDGHQVRVVDNLLTGNEANVQYLTQLNGDFEFYRTSITDLEALRPAFKGVEYVLHQAALPSVPRSMDDPLATHEHCATGTLNVLLAARDAGVKRLVYASTAAAYGDTDREIVSEDLPIQPLSPYGVAKIAAEQYCQMFTQSFGLETVSLRYFNVFGPRQDVKSHYSAVIPLFAIAVLNNKPPTIFGDGEQSRDFTYVDNVVHGNLLACHAPQAAGKVINMATGSRISLNELLQHLNTLLGTDIQAIYAPERPGDIKHSQADIRRAVDLLDYSPIVDFANGLAQTIEYYRDL